MGMGSLFRFMVYLYAEEEMKRVYHSRFSIIQNSCLTLIVYLAMYRPTTYDREVDEFIMI